MAEGVVVQPPQRFYCHLCNVEIENVSSVSANTFCRNKNKWNFNYLVQAYLFVLYLNFDSYTQTQIHSHKNTK